MVVHGTLGYMVVACMQLVHVGAFTSGCMHGSVVGYACKCMLSEKPPVLQQLL